MALTHFFVYFCFLLHFGYQLENYSIEKMHPSVFLHYTQTWVRDEILLKKRKIFHLKLGICKEIFGFMISLFLLAICSLIYSHSKGNY